jgi:hypothetical protein
LCHQTKALQKSHYLPKGGYKVNRAPALKNSDPVVLSSAALKQSSVQLKDSLLCNDCEQLFNKQGENWVLAHIPRTYGEPFPLYDTLSAKVLVVADVYAGASLKGVDVEKLVYFAMSLFWRGAVHSWDSVHDGQAPEVVLNKYEEPIRQFLLKNAPLPQDLALNVFVCPNGRILNFMLAPYETEADVPGCSKYICYISGIGFALHFGEQLPADFRTLCAYHSPQKFLIVSTEFEQRMREVLLKLVSERDDSKLKKMLAEIDKIRSTPPTGSLPRS